jgi:hypothetical protein
MKTKTYKSINALMNEAVKNLEPIRETPSTFEVTINGDLHVYNKNTNELRQSALIDKAFVAGRSRTSWCQFKKDNYRI